MSIFDWSRVAVFLVIFGAWWRAWSVERKRANMWRDECADRARNIAFMREEWHALNEEMRVTLQERDAFREKAEARKKLNDEAIRVIARKRDLIHNLRIKCQIARVQLRDFCSRPSQMMDILDKLEKDFAEDSKSN